MTNERSFVFFIHNVDARVALETSNQTVDVMTNLIPLPIVVIDQPRSRDFVSPLQQSTNLATTLLTCWETT